MSVSSIGAIAVSAPLSRPPLLVIVNGVLLLGLGGAIGLVQVSDRDGRAVEATVRSYAAALTAQQLDQAVAELAPDVRERWAGWVSGQLGNVYDVKAVSVRAPSVLDRVTRHLSGAPVQATVLMDVNKGYAGEYFQPTTRVEVRRVEGRWYLEEPLLADDTPS